MEALRTLRLAGSTLSCEALAAASDELAALLEAQGADESAVYAARVVIEELGTNVIKYAYPEGAERWLELRLFIIGSDYRLEVEDGGNPFDPLAQPEPDLSLPLEERPIGGLGIHLVRQLSGAVEYERLAGTPERNLVRVQRRLVG